ncbi:hypothetical protein [Dyella tabacisoli]|nr:hypothetical protein [Dyella tabacisoli]
MTQQVKDPTQQAQLKNARRTALVVTVVAVAIFLLSILQMLKLS